MPTPDVKEADHAGQEIKLLMFERGSEGSGYHIKNNPRNRYHRSEVIQRGGAIDIRCTLTAVVHGGISVEADEWATILAFEFRFDPKKKFRRITQATIELRFDVSSIDNDPPEIEAMSFDGHYSFRPSKQNETIKKGYGASLGASSFADVNISANWEKSITRDTTDATTVSGSKHVMNNMPPNRIAKWTLMENSTLKTGIPASIRVAVRIKRFDRSEFSCMPFLECKADKITSMENLFSRTPEDEPIYFNPDLVTKNGLLACDTEELGSVDLQTISAVTFSEMMLDQQ